jgi:hypothetical protein
MTFYIGLALGLIVFSTKSTMAQQEQSPLFQPQIVTATTLADSEALARLEAPGEIFFTDGFDTDASFDHYFEIQGQDDGRTARVDHGRQGGGAIQFTAPARGGNSSGANANLWFGPQGYDTVYFRRYIKFAADYDQGNLNHTGGGLAGVAGNGKWDGMGQAGIRPTGDDRFTSSFEPWRDWKRYAAPGYMFFYIYWMDMQQDPDGNYWGNFVEPPPTERFVPQRDRWYCLEQMVKANDIGQANGELAGWIDGRLYVHATSLRWRNVEALKIKRASFGIYIHQADKDNTVWYDDVALSTGYIGPTTPPPTAVEAGSWGQFKTKQNKTE